MTVSVFDLFKIGIGPSSSHTVGPMRAAGRFCAELRERGVLDRTADLQVELHGSLAATGRGHGTLPAVLLGLEDRRPDTITTEEVETRTAQLRAGAELALGGSRPIRFGEDAITMRRDIVLPEHPNSMTITALDAEGAPLHQQTYFSVGGGFVSTRSELDRQSADVPAGPFGSAVELLARCAEAGIPVSEVMHRFECTLRDPAAVRSSLLQLRDAMVTCMQQGLTRTGTLPGGLHVRRRARAWFLTLDEDDPDRNPEHAHEWVALAALAVNEENASGGRVVTAPTNGAAGIVPGVLHHALHYTPAGTADADATTVRFLLTAGAIGSLYKERASISGAEVGCQGEVGSAASMAAGALAEILGGTPAQVENAAEIAIEHSLGMTCDPIGGLVQIPCIERNAMAAGQAVNAARIALRGDGSHTVPLDAAIETMRRTGRDMHSRYKETSMGGLATAALPVSATEC